MSAKSRFPIKLYRKRTQGFRKRRRDAREAERTGWLFALLSGFLRKVFA